jgi:hypothetical protein
MKMPTSSKGNFLKTINHQQPDKVVVDFGSTGVTGIHALIIEKLRNFYGLEKRPVKITEPYQMLGEVDGELIQAMDVDVVGLFGARNMFGISNENWKPHKTLWVKKFSFPEISIIPSIIMVTY